MERKTIIPEQHFFPPDEIVVFHFSRLFKLPDVSRMFSDKVIVTEEVHLSTDRHFLAFPAHKSCSPSFYGESRLAVSAPSEPEADRHGRLLSAEHLFRFETIACFEDECLAPFLRPEVRSALEAESFQTIHEDLEEVERVQSEIMATNQTPEVAAVPLLERRPWHEEMCITILPKRQTSLPSIIILAVTLSLEDEVARVPWKKTNDAFADVSDVQGQIHGDPLMLS